MARLSPTLFFALALVGALAFTMMRPSFAVQAFTAVACATSSACVTGTNGSTGPGVQGTSKSGRGVLGQTNYNSTTQSNGQAGVYGIDGSTSGLYDSGVTGQSQRGNGVWGRSTSGKALFGLTTSGYGVWAQATNGLGAFAEGNTGLTASDFGAANHVDDVFANGFGANGFRFNNSHGVDVFKVADSGLTTMYQATVGNANDYTGLYAQGYPVGANGVDLSPFGGEGIRGDSSAAAGSIGVYAHSRGGFLFAGDAGGSTLFYVDNAGNVHAHSFTADLAASTRTQAGQAVATYAHEVRAPTIEDFGEAMLAAGHAYVRLDPSFASTLVRGVPYFVFITPLGPTRGSLYVSQRTPAGFFVNENGGGVSTVAFDYRIVGKRYITSASIPSVLPHPAAERPAVPAFPVHPKIH